MQESKEIDWDKNYDADSAANDVSAGRESDSHAVAAADTDGWQQYRKWISKAPAPRGRRSSVDPSLYTWKGYRTWSEQIKRDWSDN